MFHPNDTRWKVFMKNNKNLNNTKKKYSLQYVKKIHRVSREEAEEEHI